MPKRKRGEDNVRSLATHATLSQKDPRTRRKLCQQRIVAAQKPLVSALRLAAGFERQKHSRRKKEASSTKSSEAVLRLEEEYAKLKVLDFEKLAQQHLRKTIGKVKCLRESEYVPEVAKTAEKAVQDAATLNVQARLCKVDAVRKAIDEVIEDLKELVGRDKIDSKVRDGRQQPERTAREASTDEGRARDHDDGYDSEAFAMFDARIAAPSSADEDSENSLAGDLRPASIEGDERHSREHSVQDQEGSLVTVTDASDESISDAEAVGIPLIPQKRPAVEQIKAAKSTFLPSLSHAAYVSGSESEASDLDADLAPRRNRRGQKARQKIWEQKYGDKAKHVQKHERSNGWDARKGAVDKSNVKNGDGGRKRVRPGRKGPQQSGENAVPLGQRRIKRDDAGSLHPSWQAAKAAKEKKLDAKPQGTKVVFD